MKEIITFLFENSEKRDCFCENNSSIAFTIGIFHILIKVSTSDNENEELDEELEDDENRVLFHVEDINEFIRRNVDSEIIEFKIVLSEYLGERTDAVHFINDKSTIAYTPGSSAKTLFKTVREISKQLPSLSISYRFETDYPDGSELCSLEPNYNAIIFVGTPFPKLEEVALLISILRPVSEEELESVFWSAFFSKDGIKNSFESQLVSTNTKVRRLGYLKIFFTMIDEKKKIPSSLMLRKFEEYAIQYSESLNENEYKKGLIQLSNGKSAEPYLDLLKQFKLVVNIHGVILPSKKLKVYLELSRIMNNRIDKNPFQLSEFDKLFFLEIILKEDYLYSSIILELLNLKDKANVNYLIDSFQGKLLGRLSDFLRQTHEEYEPKKVKQIRLIKRRIEDWKKADVYLEHLVMPRINWFADLGLIHLSSNNEITLLDEGKQLFSTLLSWIDVNCGFVEGSSNFLKGYYPHIAGLTYRKTTGTYPTAPEILKKVKNYIDESFLLFKTLAPNRVTASQAFSYAKYSFYFNDGFSVSESYLEGVIQKEFSNIYIYKYQQRYSDGYIQKIKN